MPRFVACPGLSLLPTEASRFGKGPWWRHAVFYQVYMRSFQDSDGDGIGDLPGLISRLDYLKDLGADALWLSPCYPSPQVDFGYDISDYLGVDPIYGSLKDLDRLIAETGKRGLRIVLDLVVNHTSDQHPWFLDARSSRTAKHRDWYIWRDGKGPGQPPNNWLSTFGGSAWQLDPLTNQYYYHYFATAQPDLNWRNPAVQEAMLAVTEWWYQRGVAGFRLDAVDTLLEDEGLADNPVLPGLNPFGDPRMLDQHNRKLPENQRIFQALRKVADPHAAVTLGETWIDSVAELKKYYGEDDGLHLAMDMLLAMQPTLDATAFRDHIAEVEAAGIWPVYFLSNHDIPRSYTRFGDGQNNDAIAKLMATLQLTLRGTPILYYGEELGMANQTPRRKQDVRDPVGRRGWPKEKGRDGQRTPMPWDASPKAGFTVGTPWLPIPAIARVRNVAQELRDPGSVLCFYRKLLALRRQSPALLDGAYLPLNTDDTQVLSYLRTTPEEAILVVLNLSAIPCTVSYELAPYGLTAPLARTLLTTLTTEPGPDPLRDLALEPFGVRVASLA